jgi:exonuclease SbcC
MRLHSMRLQAFGPFPGVEEVDFEALADGGLFLLHGATGAGKTTVLDAVCFALYGVVPGVRQSAHRLRSDHADPSLDTTVVLEVTLRGRRLRLSRSPAWERPKRRGAGTTRQQPRVLVEELPCGAGDSAPATVLSTRLDEAGQLVRDLIGMSPDQFCQVVLLPQGQFAEFLRADAEARRPLLEQLFGTARFSAVEKWLVERRKEAWRELEDASAEVTALVSRVSEAAGVEHSPADLAEETVREWVESLARNARRAADSAAVVAGTAAEALEQHESGAAEARAVLDRRRRVASLHDRWQALEAVRPEWALAVARLDAARRADALAHPLASWTQMTRRVAQARRSWDTAVGQLPDADRQAGSVGDTVDALQLQASAVAAELGAVQELAALERQLQRCSEDEQRLTGMLSQATRRAGELQTQLAEAPETRRELAAELDRARAAEAVLPGERAAAEQSAARVDAARRRDATIAELASAERAMQSAVDAAQEARESWLNLRQGRLDGMAAELAAGLQPQCACPVCGSAEHPAPAQAVHGRVSEDAEHAAEELWRRRDEARQAACDRVSELTARLAAHRAAAGGDAAVNELDDAHRDAARRLRSTEQLAARTDELETALRRHDEAQAGLQRDAQETAVHLADTAARLAASEETRRAATTRLAGALGADRTVAERAHRLEHLSRVHAAAVLAGEELLRAEALEADAAESALSHARGQGFASVADAQAAALPAETLEELQSLVDAWSTEERLIREHLATPELAQEQHASLSAVEAGRAAAALDAAERHLAVVLAARAEATARCELAAGDLREARSRAERLETLTVALEHALDAVRPLRERHAVVEGLSRLAEGSSADNSLRMRLSAYVLAARLEQVALAASQRLVRMSGGRYTLEHTDAAAGGRSRSGLGLLVRDAWTGVTREPSTLSGGESFFASLALALGLADVVTAEAGGALIETLFIDEGFGTLDDETLEEVLAVLDDLREGGRAVGIVSHVADLRARIPAQLHVRKGPNGSTLAPLSAARGAA